MQLNELKKKVKQASETKVERAKVPAISYSQFSMFANCPKRWELAYIEKHRIYTPSIHTVFGTSLHETLQNYLTVVFEESVKAADSINLEDYLTARMLENYKQEVAKRGGEHFTTPEELTEFQQDGVAILNWIKKRRRIYFGPKGYELLGIEVPIHMPVNLAVNPVVHITAYLDLVLYDKTFNRVKIIDIKTSTRGWSDKEKKDAIKKSQVMLYKSYFSSAFNVPLEDIEVEYFIVRRKLYEESEFPQKRVQTFTPAQGRTTLNKVSKWVDEFLTKAFNQDGTHNTGTTYPAISGPNGENCKFCEYKDKPKLCPANKRLKVISDKGGDD